MDVIIGSNLFRNTDGTVEVEGVPQIEVKLQSPSGPLLVNFVVFDENGRLTAKIVDSSMSFNEAGVYALARTATSVKMTHAESGKVVLQVELKEPDRVAIPCAEFLTAKAHLLEVTSLDWRIGQTRSKEGESDAKGGAVAIG